jgi:hypothetical protein
MHMIGWMSAMVLGGCGGYLIRSVQAQMHTQRDRLEITKFVEELSVLRQQHELILGLIARFDAAKMSRSGE